MSLHLPTNVAFERDAAMEIFSLWLFIEFVLHLLPFRQNFVFIATVFFHYAKISLPCFNFSA